MTTLALLVGAAHLGLVDWLAEDRFGWGRGEATLKRIEVAFVSELAQQAPPAAAAPAERAPRGQGSPRLAAVTVAIAVPTPASAPSRDREGVAPAAANSESSALADAATPPAPVVAGGDANPAASAEPVPAPAPAGDAPTVVANAPPPAPEGPAAANAAPTAAADTAPTAAASTAPATTAGVNASHTAAFDWPPSTRLSYVLLGNYRGPVHGRAQVEWLRSGSRYQVHLEASVTPFLSRRVSSEGELTEHGLAPRTMHGEQRVMLRTPRRWTLKFGPDKVTLVDGREEPAQPGMQDEASQFVQLTWIFTTRPQLLQVGRTLDLPLALSRRLERWTFEVKAEESLQLPFGEVPTFHVKPRREIAKGGDMVAQMWFAPSLQYLPVRILIHQDAETWIDLQLEKPPLQAAR